MLLGMLPGLMAATPSSESRKAAPLSALGRMQIKELTVFKDGYVFVAQEGQLPTETSGDALIDQLPRPVMGAFWPYSLDKRARLNSVVASQRRVLVERTALSLPELLQANEGADCFITEVNSNRFAATIVGFPTRSSAELRATSPPDVGERLPETGNLVLLKTAEGTKAMSLDRIQDVTFTRAQRSMVAREEFRQLLTLQLDWGAEPPARSVNLGLLYLQKGVRWIPSYKIELDGQSNALVRLQACIINELSDLEYTTLNLVIGAPNFAFKDSLDPMALQQTAAQLSQYLQSDPRPDLRNSALASNFSNAIMSQAMPINNIPSGTLPASFDAGIEGAESTRNEDLYVFQVKVISLKKGERIVMPIAEFKMNYQDVFTLDLPFAPPPEVRENRLNSSQQQELARLIGAPKVMHKIRLANQSRCPLTTAPALVLRDGRLLGQTLMTYTPVSASTDLTITTAVEIAAKKTDQETKRTPNAVSHNGRQFTRVDLAGTIHITNRRPAKSSLEITRHVLGDPDSATRGGEVQKVNVFEDGGFSSAPDYPVWWSWYGWPEWWSHFNGMGRITWKVALEPKEDLDLRYVWHYFCQ